MFTNRELLEKICLDVETAHARPASNVWAPAKEIGTDPTSREIMAIFWNTVIHVVAPVEEAEGHTRTHPAHTTGHTNRKSLKGLSEDSF